MQAEAPRELEAKFSLDRHEELDALIESPDLPDDFVIGDTQVVWVADTYLDTRDMRLLRHGYTLRLRKKGSKRLITLKSLEDMHGGHIQNRLEIEKPLPPGSQIFGLLGWHKEIRRIVVQVAGKKPDLHPICNVQQTRHKEWLHSRLTDPESTASGMSDSPVAELSLDQVAVSGDEISGNEADGDGANEPISEGSTSRFFEVELELLDTDQESAFYTLVEWLESRPALSPVLSSKLVTGLRVIAAQPLDAGAGASITSASITNTSAVAVDDRSGIQPQMQMADACRLIWRQQMTEMNLNESGVRADQDIEYVHDMRVATRRARAGYVLFGEEFKQKRVQAHVEFFKRTAKRLGSVRDLDVALQKMRSYRRQLPEDERKAMKPVAKLWRRERRRHVKELHKWLESDAYALALIELDAFCRTPGAGAKRQSIIEGEPPPLVQVRHRLPSQILARFAAVRRYESVFAQTKRVPLTTLHALRIDCKYLRYVLEFSRHLLGRESEVIIAQLKELQDLLGDLSDADFACDMLQGLPPEISDDNDHGRAVAAYIEKQKAIIETLREQAPDAFADFIAPENIRLLGQAVAAL